MSPSRSCRSPGSPWRTTSCRCSIPRRSRGRRSTCAELDLHPFRCAVRPPSCPRRGHRTAHRQRTTVDSRPSSRASSTSQRLRCSSSAAPQASTPEPAVSGNELVYSGDLSSPGQTSTLSFAIRPTGLYSSGQGGTGSTTVTTNGKSVSSNYNVTVRDPFAASGLDGVVLDFDTLYVQEITDFDVEADSGRPIATFRFDLSTGYAPGSLLSVTLSNIDANADLDLSLFADVPGALPEAGDLSFDDQAEATGRSRFIGHARNVGQVQPLDVNTIGRSRFIGESADGSAVVQTEAPAESREDVVTESGFGPLAAVSSNRDDQAESVAAIVGPAEQFQVKVSPYNGQESGAVLLARAEAAPEADGLWRRSVRIQCQCVVRLFRGRQEHRHPHGAWWAFADEPHRVRIASEGERRDRHRHPARRLADRILVLGSYRQRRGRRRCRSCSCRHSTTTPTLQNVVIVGDHSVIPHAAIPETVECRQGVHLRQRRGRRQRHRRRVDRRQLLLRRCRTVISTPCCTPVGRCTSRTSVSRGSSRHGADRSPAGPIPRS